MVENLSLEEYSVLADFGNPETIRFCFKCGFGLPESNFLTRNVCKLCARKRQKEYVQRKRQENPQATKEKDRIRRLKNIDKVREWSRESAKRKRHENIEKSREQARMYYAKNRERINEYKRGKYKLQDKDKRYQKKKVQRLVSLYGISPEEYNRLYEEQMGKCSICGVHENNRFLDSKKGNPGLFVDHDHETKKVRGLLCINCNFMIGNFRDDIDIIRKAIQYVEDNFVTEIEYNRVRFSYKPNSDKVYSELLSIQNEKCFICGSIHSSGRLFIDHDRKTNKVRRLLCRYCNAAIGYGNENIRIFKKAISYIEYWNKKGGDL